MYLETLSTTIPLKEDTRKYIDSLDLSYYTSIGLPLESCQGKGCKRDKSDATRLRILVEARAWENMPYVTRPPELEESSSFGDNAIIGNFTMQSYSYPFLSKTDFNSIWDCVNSSLFRCIPDKHLTHKELYAVVCLLLCIRSEILRVDCTRRGSRYRSIYQFDKFMYYPYSDIPAPVWDSTNNIALATVCSIFSDIAQTLFSTYFYRNSKNNHRDNYIFTSFDVEVLKQLKMFLCLNTEKSFLLFQILLLHIWNNLTLLDSMLRQKSMPNEKESYAVSVLKSQSKDSLTNSILLLQIIFRRLELLEQFVLTI